MSGDYVAGYRRRNVLTNCHGIPDPHVFPVVIEFLAAVETNDVSSLPAGFGG